MNEKYILKNNDVVEMFLYEDKFKEFTATKDIYNVKRHLKFYMKIIMY